MTKSEQAACLDMIAAYFFADASERPSAENAGEAFSAGIDALRLLGEKDAVQEKIMNKRADDLELLAYHLLTGDYEGPSSEDSIKALGAGAAALRA